MSNEDARSEISVDIEEFDKFECNPTAADIARAKKYLDKSGAFLARDVPQSVQDAAAKAAIDDIGNIEMRAWG